MPVIRGTLYYNIVFVLLQLVNKNMFILPNLTVYLGGLNKSLN